MELHTHNLLTACIFATYLHFSSKFQLNIFLPAEKNCYIMFINYSFHEIIDTKCDFIWSN